MAKMRENVNDEFVKEILEGLAKGLSADLLESYIYIIECYRTSKVYGLPGGIKFMEAMRRITARHITNRIRDVRYRDERGVLIDDLRRLQTLEIN